MEILFESPIYRICWHDDQRQILLLEIFQKWTWQDAYEGVTRSNNIAKAATHDICTILYFHDNVGMLPKGGSGIPTLRQLAADDPPREKLVVIINQNALLEIFLSTVGKAYRLGHMASKYRYAKTLDEALQMVKHFQASGKTG
ncbi:MAG TPA: hypothetical protein PLQ56_04460 [Aggregatilineales bacterium]|nr:hypothetical protein [Anaerolineae bacterium]HUN05823.1 hypothetical protein [Aggregatilineales bacterium]